jgi:hypothetical protein
MRRLGNDLGKRRAGGVSPCDCETVEAAAFAAPRRSNEDSGPAERLRTQIFLGGMNHS